MTKAKAGRPDYVKAHAIMGNAYAQIANEAVHPVDTSEFFAVLHVSAAQLVASTCEPQALLNADKKEELIKHMVASYEACLRERLNERLLTSITEGSA